ncbi:MAG: PASTA domain-containing protein [Actinobacteria bacterium]|nr:PASTA domain-containing protein [Actinomycetota bacterium]
MSDYQPSFIGEKRNAPIWQVFAVVVVLMVLAASSFYYGSKHPSSGFSTGSDYSTDYGTDGTADYGTDGGTDYYDDGSSGGGTQVQTYILNNFIGFGSTSVEQTIRASGLFVNTRYTNGDPSLNARLNNGCVVIDQSPAAGTEVYAGSTVVILADCPLTGQG